MLSKYFIMTGSQFVGQGTQAQETSIVLENAGKVEDFTDSLTLVYFFIVTTTPIMAQMYEAVCFGIKFSKNIEKYGP